MLNMTNVLCCLGRYQEAHEAAVELVAFTKATFGLEDVRTLAVRNTYAGTCTKIGRVEEAKATFEDVLTIETRILGRDHPETQDTRRKLVALLQT